MYFSYVYIDSQVIAKTSFIAGDHEVHVAKPIVNVVISCSPAK